MRGVGPTHLRRVRDSMLSRSRFFRQAAKALGEAGFGAFVKGHGGIGSGNRLGASYSFPRNTITMMALRGGKHGSRSGFPLCVGWRGLLAHCALRPQSGRLKGSPRDAPR